MSAGETEGSIRWPGWVHPEGTVAIVTGAGSGIGQAAAILAAQQGLKVAAWDINAEGAQRTIDRAGKHGPAICAFRCRCFQRCRSGRMRCMRRSSS